MSVMPVGFAELTYDRQTGEIIRLPVRYAIVERDGKRHAEPVDRPRGSIGIGDNTIGIDTWWPLEHTPCSTCGVYGLVHTIHIGEYACANCGDKCILAPGTVLHVRAG